MTIQYDKLKEKIFLSVSPVLESEHFSYTRKDILDAIDLMYGVIRHRVHPLLNGLSKYIEPALEKSYFSEIGNLGPLGTLSDRIEGFLRKIMILCDPDATYDSVSRINLVAQFKKLNLSSKLNKENPALEEANLVNLNNAECLFSLCMTRVTRNTVHDAPDWTDIQVLERRNHVLTVYVYATLKHIDCLKSKVSATLENTEKDDSHSSEQAMLYDFITFSKSTTSIREKIVESYLLHALYEFGGMTIDEIKSSADEYFSHSLPKTAYKKLIRKLSKKVYINDESITLKESEITRIESAKSDYEQNKIAFNEMFQDVLNTYGLGEKYDLVLEQTRLFFEENYELDLSEAYDNGFKEDKDGNLLYKNYFNFLKSITTDDDKVAQQIFVDILEICEANDFLLRLSASHIFTNITGSENFQHYADLTQRNVFLDTQLILYGIIYYAELEYESKYENLNYLVFQDLMSLVRRNKNVVLNFSPTYISEVSFQVGKALSLIPYDELLPDTKLSNNIIYEYFWSLKSKGRLDSKYSLADFMSDQYSLLEADLYDSSYRGIINKSIYDVLDRLNINVPRVPRYSQNDIDEASKILSDALYAEKLKEKTGLILKNDALMVCHLSNKEEHIIEPVFLTWDKSFSAFRRKYLGKFMRKDVLGWHLFNPSRFISHISLLKLKINPQAVTQDILSIMDGYDFKEQISTIYEVQSKIVQISSSDVGAARRNAKILKTVFENEFENSVNDLADKNNSTIRKAIMDLDEVIGSIIDYLQDDSTPISIARYRNLVNDENNFTEFTTKLLMI
jgi:hypothetical protein